MTKNIVYGKIVRWDNSTEQTTVELEDGSIALMDKREACLTSPSANSWSASKFIYSILGIDHIAFHLITDKDENGEKKVSLRSVMLDTYKRISVGDILETKIIDLTKHSIFMRYDNFVTIRTYYKDISNSFIDNVSKFYSVGETIKIKVIKKDDDNYFIDGSIKDLCYDTLENYHAGDILEGRIAKADLGNYNEDGYFEDSYFVEISPHVAGIFDSPINYTTLFRINDRVVVQVLRVKTKGLKLKYLHLAR